MDEIRDILADKTPKWYSLLDLKSGYHQCQLTEDSQEKAAFCTSNSGNWAQSVCFLVCNVSDDDDEGTYRFTRVLTTIC